MTTSAPVSPFKIAKTAELSRIQLFTLGFGAPFRDKLVYEARAFGNVLPDHSLSSRYSGLNSLEHKRTILNARDQFAAVLDA